MTGPEQTAGFDEQRFRDTKEKYYQVLNIVGKRLADLSSVTLTLVGCNSDTGKEKGNRKYFHPARRGGQKLPADGLGHST
ncbi:MAG: hypothetical protein MZW92_45255 [Comamonadaceae bacterium]|nr:hypothetical protein [Comamonadaceae bacterium]